ncbi:MAG: response regulator [Spirochaetaceae bacterium]|nr:MAG: response regulator [Spirochaetaceae bacterium]
MARTDKKVRIFSALEVANICGVVNQTAINWIKNGYLKAFTTPGGQYRVYSEDLVEFLHSRGMRMPEELEKILEKQMSIQTIAIIDDDHDFNDLLKQYIEKEYENRTILQAFDGFDAGRVLAESKPGLILLDIDLPGVDGHKLCRTVKADAGLQNPIVIAISGLDAAKERESILADGADAFIAKPVKFDELSRVINEAVKKRSGA